MVQKVNPEPQPCSFEQMPQRAEMARPPELPDASVLALPGMADLLRALRSAATGPQPERELTALLAQLTGGFAEIRASWGDVVASSGQETGPLLIRRLTYSDPMGDRQVGTLTLSVPEAWRTLLPLASEYALLARLQAAAAGAARRRVGERALEALLSGTLQSEEASREEPVAIAVAAFTHSPRPGTVGRGAFAQALDVLTAVGEGYFLERGYSSSSTVRGERGVWLWHPTKVERATLEREARDLHRALTVSTAREVRVGVSGLHMGLSSVRAAEREARQALAATHQKQMFTTYHTMDPLYALLTTGALDTLHDQLIARLCRGDDKGRIVSTLRSFLSFAGSLPELAEHLHIHVNTLRYRLKRAEELLGGSLKDPALLARLYLAFEAERSSEIEKLDDVRETGKS